MNFAESLEVDGREIIFFYDQSGKTGKKYGVYTGSGVLNFGYHETAYFIIDKNGVIQYKHVGSALTNQTETLLDEIDSWVTP